MHPEDGVHTTCRLSDIVSVALVTNDQVDMATQLGVQAVRMTQEQARTLAGLTQQPHD